MTATRPAFIAALLAPARAVRACRDADPQSDAFWYGTAADGSPTVRLYYFFSPTCPHCQAAKPFVDEFAARTPWLEIKRYAVKDNRDNARFYYDTAKSLGVEALSVPGFVFCRQVHHRLRQRRRPPEPNSIGRSKPATPNASRIPARGDPSPTRAGAATRRRRDGDRDASGRHDPPPARSSAR